ARSARGVSGWAGGIAPAEPAVAMTRSGSPLNAVAPGGRRAAGAPTLAAAVGSGPAPESPAAPPNRRQVPARTPTIPGGRSPDGRPSPRRDRGQPAPPSPGRFPRTRR